MKKFLLPLLLALTAALPLAAQRYEKLWAEADAAVERDQPRTALAAVERVYRKALAEGDDAQLLRAAVSAQQLKAAIAPDSGRVALARMEAALAAERDPALRALWHCALMQLTAPHRWSADTAATRRAARHAEAALADVPALAAARAADFLPLFRTGRDSRYYADDLLHVVWATVADAPLLADTVRLALTQRVARHYAAAGRREAALLVGLRAADFLPATPGLLAQQPAWQAVEALAAANADLPLALEAYIALAEMSWTAADADSLRWQAARTGLERYGRQPRAAALRRALAELERTELRAELGGPDHAGPLCPEQALPVVLTARHVEQAELRFTPLRLTAREYNYNIDDIDLDRRAAGPAQRVAHRFAAAPPYAWQTDTLRWTPPAPGYYRCQLVADGRRLSAELVAVTRLVALQFVGPDGRVRFTVVDAATGHPVAGARLVVADRSTGRQLAAVGCDAQGTAWLNPAAYPARARVYFSTADDVAAEPVELWRTGRQPAASAQAAQPEARVQLFTDRAVYRPGQTVHLAAVAHVAEGDDRRAEPRFEAWVHLLDASRRAVDSLLLRADELGAAGGRLQLPAECLPGVFRLTGQWGGRRFDAHFRVEEYRRPALTAELHPVERPYVLGDTLTLSGEAATMTGLPVAGAEVRWRLECTSRWGGAAEPLQSGTAATDAAGRFAVSVALTPPAERGLPVARWAPVHYLFSYDVVAPDGEVASGSTLVGATDVAARLVCLGGYERICREAVPALTVEQQNAMGRNFEARGSYALLRGDSVVASGPFVTGRPFVPAVAALPSGAYGLVLRLVPGEGALARPDTLRTVLFSESDVRPAAPDVCFAHARTSAAGDTARVLFGTAARDVCVFYDLVARDSVVESRRLLLTDSLAHFTLAWQPAYGDVARALFAFVRDGQVHRFEAAVQRPAPDRQLRLAWSTFRSRLTPGAQEEWRLRVLGPDGRPVHASVMARLYDASLDALARQPWAFAGLDVVRRWPRAHWLSPMHLAPSIWGSRAVRTEKVVPLSFTTWRPGLFGYGRGGRYYALASVEEAALSADGLAMPRMRQASNVDLKVAAAGATADADATAAVADASGAAQAAALRSDFAETALFAPSLLTDSTGTVALRFTLPQSLTSWHFTALAHTATMRHAVLDTIVVARKELMVEASLPRFLRAADEVGLPATLRNLTPRALDATVSFSLTDAATGRTLARQQRRVALPADSSLTLTFPYTAGADGGLLVCRVEAQAGTFSDGEERYLPVLADEVRVERSLPFALTQAGTARLAVDTLWSERGGQHRRLTVELTSRPAWQAVAALPALADEPCLNAEQWAARYYALVLGAAVARFNPEVRAALDTAAAQTAGQLAAFYADRAAWADATPWLAEAAREARRAAALGQLLDPAAAAQRELSALARLRAAQRADGAWGWFEGMPANLRTTAEVTLLLARVEALTGQRDAAPVLDRAVAYLQREARAEVERMKREQQRTGRQPAPGGNMLRYLYVLALRGAEPDAAARYLLDATERHAATLPLELKAMAVNVLARHGRTATAREQLQSLVEYTVADPSRGRYFDTPLLPSRGQAYRLGAQAAAIEALLCFHPSGNETVQEMRLGLMQARRAQQWPTSRTTTDAVWALLAASPLDSSLLPLAGGSPLRYTLSRGRHIVAAPDASSVAAPQTLGYVRHSYTEAPALEATTLTVHKADEGLSWGTVRAAYSLPAADVEAGGTGLSLERRVEVMRGGQWQRLPQGGGVERGERVRQVLTLRAEADCDFVRITAPRAATLEPLRPLSGYTVAGRTGAYRAVGDARTDFYVERVAKGELTLTDEAVATRRGTFQLGVATASCVYAPELNARTAALRLDVR